MSGPWEWVLLREVTETEDADGSPRYVERDRVLHHQSCRLLEAVEWPSTLEEPVTREQAVQWVAAQSAGYDAVRTCVVCAGPILVTASQINRGIIGRRW